MFVEFIVFSVIGAIAYYAVGYAFAYGEPGNAFIGHNFFFADNLEISNVSSNVSVSINNT